MSEDKESDVFYFAGCLLFFLVFLIAVSSAFYSIGIEEGEQKTQTQAIENGYGLHHPKTGKFIWQCDFEEGQE